MDQDQPQKQLSASFSGQRKIRFRPKIPAPSQSSQPTAPTPELKNEDDAETQDQQLARQFNEANAQPGPIVENDSSTVEEDGDYIEPWDYKHTYYPTTLPLRPPNSGDPELLDEAEFGEAARNLEYIENASNAASELKLLHENNEKRMLLFQHPAKLPLGERPASKKMKEKAESSTSVERVGAPVQASLDELPAGHMGKLLVYKSGAVKWKLGDTLYNVSAGTDCSFYQEIAAINTKEKQCCVLGKLDNRRVVVSPDIDSIFPDKSG